MPGCRRLAAAGSYFVIRFGVDLLSWVVDRQIPAEFLAASTDDLSIWGFVCSFGTNVSDAGLFACTDTCTCC